MTRVNSGPWAGHVIRRARKAGSCDYRKGALFGGRCGHPIKVGDLYLEGALDPYRAGGYGCERYCLGCAGAEALAAAKGYRDRTPAALRRKG